MTIISTQQDLAQLCSLVAERDTEERERQAALFQRIHGEREPPRWRISQAAQLIGVAASTLRYNERQGVIAEPKHLTASGERIYTLEEINTIRRALQRDALRPAGSRVAAVSFSQQKGGVGKSTHALHFAQYAARRGYRVLLIDLEPQATVTSAFIAFPELVLGDDDDAYQALAADPKLLRSRIRSTHWDGLDLVPATPELNYIDWTLAQPEQNNNPELGRPVHRLRRALDALNTDHDIIVLDTPPSMGMLAGNALAAADIVIAPLVPHRFDLASSAIFFRQLGQLALAGATRLQRLAVLINRVDPGRDVETHIGLIERIYGGLILPARMGTTAELEKASADHFPSIYDIIYPRGSRDTYKRAIAMMDAVNAQILNYAVEFWDQQACNQLTASVSDTQARGMWGTGVQDNV